MVLAATFAYAACAARAVKRGLYYHVRAAAGDDAIDCGRIQFLQGMPHVLNTEQSTQIASCTIRRARGGWRSSFQQEVEASIRILPRAPRHCGRKARPLLVRQRAVRRPALRRTLFGSTTAVHHRRPSQSIQRPSVQEARSRHPRHPLGPDGKMRNRPRGRSFAQPNARRRSRGRNLTIPPLTI
jgi:hypothetical protein